jgi:predicted HTH transcriptional regulator
LISKPTTVEQIDAWRKAESETENLEFKEAKERFGFPDILSYCVAIANERGGILLLGISNKPPRPVVGTKAYPSVERLKKDILDRLHFRVDVEAVPHPDGRVLVFHIPSRPTGHPYHLDGAYFMRCGESLVPMTTDQLQQIIEEEMSPLAKKILYMIGAIAVFTLLLLIYLGTEHLWRTESQPSANKTVNERALGAKMVPST